MGAWPSPWAKAGWCGRCGATVSPTGCATGDGKVQGVLAMLCVCLPVLLVKSAVFSVHGASGLFDNLSNGFSERAWACQAGSIYDTWTKDQGVLAPSYRFRSGTWVRAR
ncbi:hypothetical protein ACFJI0_26595 [Hydrogenophaga sp. UC242_53]|uniref:hypothetical protein n=1 Tax=Hydrogenophaga sp. UC242_53 TaxID=3350170 RepID=UPI0036D2B760